MIPVQGIETVIKKNYQMKIAIIGATGFVGSEVLKEALNRGHQVTAVARNIKKFLLIVRF